MHKLDKSNKVGRLLALVHRKEPKRNLSFFFPVEGLEQLARLRKVTTGLQETAKNFESEYEFRTYSVADMSQVLEDFPNVDEKRIWWMDIKSWIDEEGQFTQDFASRVLEWRLKSPSDHLPELAPGKIVKETDFFNQEKIIDRLWELISSGKNLLLAAPRRFGKSSLINHLTDHSRKGIKACHVDLEEGASAADFVRLIFKGLMDRQVCRDCLPPDIQKQLDEGTLERKKIEIIRAEWGKIEKDWRSYGNKLFERMNQIEEHFLLMLDEFSWLLENMIRRIGSEAQEVQDLLEWFSEVCRKYDRLSVIVTGSEHLDSYLEANQLPNSLIDHLEKVLLEPFGGDIAKLFSFLALFKQEIVVTPAGLQEISDLIGRPIPYFLQVFLDLLQNECHRAGSLSSGDFQNIYFNSLLGRDAKRYFEYIDHQIERYDRYGLPMDSVKKILAALGQESQVEIKVLSAMWETLPGKRPFKFLMALLKNDFFVVEQAGLASMECKIFRDYFALRTI